MELSNIKLVNSIGVLSKLLNKELNIKVSFAIAKNIDSINRELETYNKEKQKLIDKYSIKDSNGETKVNEDNTINLSPDKVDEFSKEHGELLELINEVNIYLIDSNDLFGSDCNITPGELMIIKYMFK